MKRWIMYARKGSGYVLSFKRMRKSIVSFLICGALLASTALLQAGAQSRASMQNEKSQLQSEADKLDQEIEKLKEQQAEQQKLKEELQKKISNTEKQIALCAEEIAGLDSEIDSKEAQIEQKSAELEQNKELFKQRLRAMYMSGGNSDLLMLLGADDFADYLNRAELSRSVSEHDNALMEEIVSAITVVEEEKAAIEDKKEERTQVKKQLAEKRSTLKDDMAEINALIAQIGEDKAEAEEERDEKEAAIADLEKEIQAAIRQSSSSGSSGSSSGAYYAGSDFGWPCPGYYNITSGFKWRWGRQHKGIDISSSGISGKPIVASQSGTVILAGYNNGGYGNYVMIDHGGGYVTLYGHMSSYIVSSGQHVSQGQTIGYVGNTGRSTGPHLHFEVRVNGTPVDPTQFFNKVG